MLMSVDVRRISKHDIFEDSEYQMVVSLHVSDGK